MSTIDMSTLALLQAAADPTSSTFTKMMEDLLDAAGGKIAVNKPVKGDEPWKRIFPYCGSPVENKVALERYEGFTLSNYPTFTQGVLSLIAMFDQVAELFYRATRNPSNRVLVVSSYARELCDMFAVSDPGVTAVDFCHTSGVPEPLMSTDPDRKRYNVVIYDHTTLGLPLQALLEVAKIAGVQLVEGIFWHSAAVDFGWSGVYGEEKILVQHTAHGLYIGPQDDPTRLLFHRRRDYAQFTYPTLLQGSAREFYYELKAARGIGRYTAYNIGVPVTEDVTFMMPYTTEKELLTISVDRRFAGGVFSSTEPGERHSAEAATKVGWFSSHRDYFFQVRRKLFDDCVIFLVGMKKGTDLMTEATRYITAHNYSDLFEGTRVIKAHSSNYTDALCLATVCAIQAYTLRYNLTRESMRALGNIKFQASIRSGDYPMGPVGKLVMSLLAYAKVAVVDTATDALARAKSSLHSSDLIPGIFYDVYVERSYQVGGSWTEHAPRKYEEHDYDGKVPTFDDPMTKFMGEKVSTSGPSYVFDDEAVSTLKLHRPEMPKYRFQPVPEPAKKLQEVYDCAFPGNSIADLANVAELRKTRDIDTQMEFSGRVQINMDKSKREQLHHDMPIRTAALPVGRGGVLDALLASAKRNFSSPDIHTVADAFGFAKRLVHEFIQKACIPGAADLCRNYKKRPLHFDVCGYAEWAAGKSEAYRAALLGEMPDEIVTLGLDKYTTILKSRIKPKLSVGAQAEIGQPQVVVHQTKKETALFSPVFREIFKRFDSILKDGFRSAGRLSDQEISEWATSIAPEFTRCKLLEGDSSMYDKSQSLLAMLIEVVMFEELGCAVTVIEMLKNTFVGGVTASSAGLAFIIALQRKSGHGDTMLGNLAYNFTSIGHSVGYENMRGCIGKGDDNVVLLLSQLFEGEHAAVVAKKMGLYFNLETKMILHDVPAFSSGGFVPVGNRVVFFPDPLKLVELLGERQVDASRTIREQFISFQDRVSAYAEEGVPEAVHEWTRRRYKTDADIKGAIDAFLTLAEDFEAYSAIKDPPR